MEVVLDLILSILGSFLCDCFLGLLGLVSATGGAVEARRGGANRLERRLAKQAGQEPPPVSRDNWFALVLFLLAITCLVMLGILWIVSWL
jgi:hypothetical protein